MSKEYRIPKNIKTQDLVRGIINASYWHWHNIDEIQHTEAIKHLNNLEAIDKVKSSDALECLEVIGSGREDNMKFREVFEKEYNTILKALLKAQEDEKLKVDICEMFGLDNLFPYNDTKAILKELEEYMGRKNQLWVDFMKTSKESKEQEKVLEIINKKCVDIYLLKSINTLEEYNKNIGLRGIELTQEEFELLKAYFEKNIQK